MDITEVKTKMEKAIDNMSSQLVGMHSGGLSAGLVDTVKVEYYGQLTPIKQLAQTVDVAQGISVQPHEPNMCGPIVTALKRAGLEAYPFSKIVVMVQRPKLSGDTKNQVKAQIAKIGEDAKIAIRSIRQNFKKAMSGSEDEMRNGEKLAQHYTDQACRLVDEMVEQKCAKL